MTRFFSRQFAGALLALLAVTANAQETEVAAMPKYVQMTTTLGDLYIELYPEQAPITVANFLQYVNDGFYDGTVFHRIVPGFVIQGGGFTAELVQKQTRAPIKNEADNMLKNMRGTLSMARTAVVDSGTTQFFVNLADNRALDHSGTTHSRAWGYAVFGAIARGMEVVDQIAAVPTGPAGRFRSDVPQEPVIILSAKTLEALPAVEVEAAPEPTDEAAAPVDVDSD